MKIPITIPLLDEKEAQEAFDAVLSGWVTQGPRVEQFENKFATYVGTKFAVAVSNCTTALQLSLIVGGIKTGDEVICPSMSFIATANAIVNVGATPIFAEVRSDYNLDPEDVIAKITPKTKAILLVHQIGMPADIDVFKAICKKNNLILIEDAACAIGASYNGQKIGSHSDLVCFSFHPRKIITTGDGGMITTSNPEYNRRLRLLRQHGMSVNDRERHLSKKVVLEEYLEIGFNFRMTDVQAAMGIHQMDKLPGIVKKRREIAARFNKEFLGLKGVIVPKDNINSTSNYQSYSLILTSDSPIERNELMQKLLDVGVATRRGIMTSHREKAYKNNLTNLPTSEELADNSILLPIYPQLTEVEIEYIIDKFKSFF